MSEIQQLCDVPYGWFVQFHRGPIVERPVLAFALIKTTHGRQKIIPVCETMRGEIRPANEINIDFDLFYDPDQALCLKTRAHISNRK